MKTTVKSSRTANPPKPRNQSKCDLKLPKTVGGRCSSSGYWALLQQWRKWIHRKLQTNKERKKATFVAFKLPRHSLPSFFHYVSSLLYCLRFVADPWWTTSYCLHLSFSLPWLRLLSKSSLDSCIWGRNCSFSCLADCIFTPFSASFFQIHLDPRLPWATRCIVVWRIRRENHRHADRAVHLCQPSGKHSRSVHDKLSQPSSQRGDWLRRRLQRCDRQCCSSNALWDNDQLPNCLQRSWKWWGHGWV